MLSAAWVLNVGEGGGTHLAEVSSSSSLGEYMLEP